MRYFISIGYDGTHYHGWQIQPNAITVQEIVNDAISKIAREKVNVVGCGRTDTGVHASFFALHVDIQTEISTIGKFLYHLNAVLPSDVVAYDMVAVPDDLHARFSARWREYHYYFATRHQPFLHRFSMRLVKNPDLELLNQAARVVLENTDFASFCKSHSANKTNICNVVASEWYMQNDLLVYRVKADRFLRNMVRALTGTMLEIGMGKRTPGSFQAVFDSQNRSAAGMSVDPHGLFLTGVWYPEPVFSQSQRKPF
ncbi:MAG: tRNA pseudouridine(38-40) synthase TruA [Salinivirgaceae bacterium]|nr:tRNA pseudouridine(38-40) synthase TruA [Salinivirgaceae bacterium]